MNSIEYIGTFKQVILPTKIKTSFTICELWYLINKLAYFENKLLKLIKLFLEKYIIEIDVGYNIYLNPNSLFDVNDYWQYHYCRGIFLDKYNISKQLYETISSVYFDMSSFYEEDYKKLQVSKYTRYCVKINISENKMIKAYIVLGRLFIYDNNQDVIYKNYPIILNARIIKDINNYL